MVGSFSGLVLSGVSIWHGWFLVPCVVVLGLLGRVNRRSCGLRIVGLRSGAVASGTFRSTVPFLFRAIIGCVGHTGGI